MNIRIRKNEITESSANTPFYSSEAYIRFHAPERFYELMVEENNKSARIYLFDNGTSFISPFRAPFGGILSENSINVPLASALLSAAKQLAEEKGKHSIEVTCCPDGLLNYDVVDELREAFRVQDFVISNIELNQHLDVNKQNFESFCSSAARRRIRKAENAGFRISNIVFDDKSLVYQFIREARNRKHFPLRISEQVFTKSIETFPDRYVCFSVTHYSQLAAVAVGVKVTPKLLYYYLPADHEAFLSYSPALLVLKSMYAYCQENDISCLDLGISTDQGARNEGLIKFKEGISAKASEKVTFLWKNDSM